MANSGGRGYRNVSNIPQVGRRWNHDVREFACRVLAVFVRCCGPSCRWGCTLVENDCFREGFAVVENFAVGTPVGSGRDTDYFLLLVIQHLST